MGLAQQISNRTPFYYGWIILFSAGSSLFARNASASVILAIFIYPISEELGWSRTVIAGAAAFGGLAASCASPLVGWIIDRHGCRIVLSVSIFVLGLSTISLAWATAPVAFYLAYGTGRVLFSSPIQIGSSVIVLRWFFTKRGRASGFLSLSHSLGMTLFPLLASIVILIKGYQTAWIILGLTVWGIALLPVSLLLRETPQTIGLSLEGVSSDLDIQAQKGSLSAESDWTVREAALNPTLWLLAVGIGSLYVIHSGINIHLVAYLRDQGLNEGASAAAISVTAVMTAVGSLFWGWIVDHLSIRFSLATVALIIGVTSLGLLNADEMIKAYFFSGLFGFGLGGLLVVPPVVYSDYFGNESLGTIRGITEPFISLGQATGAVTSGLIYDITNNYTIAFWGFTLIGILTAIGMASIRKPIKTK